jgi:hypothetical protein
MPPDLAARVDRWRRLAVAAVMPTLILAAICNQDRPYPFVLALGQLASWLSITLAAVVVIATFSGRIWPWLLVAGTFALRSTRVLNVGGNALDTPYTVVLAVLLAATAAVLLAQQAALVRRQMQVLMTLSLPLMVMQLLGLPAEAHLLRTDLHVEEDRLMRMVPVLFEPPESVIITTLQARPAGWFHANNFFSMFLIFAMAVLLGRPRRGAITIHDVVLVLVLTLSMAKTAFVAFAVMLMALFVLGTAPQRRYALKMSVLFGAGLACYAVLFPGLFAYTMSIDLARTNLDLRMADLLLATGNRDLADLARSISTDTRLVPGEGTQSGYALLAAGGAAVLIGLAIAVPLYAALVRRFVRRFPEWRMTLILCSIALATIPAMTSFIGSPTFGFMSGLALLPTFALVEPRFEQLMRTPVSVPAHPAPEAS